MSEPFPAIDRRAARRNFERAAPGYAGASRLESEVGARMLERLDYVKLAPRRVLDAGSGPPQRRLARRYPRAQVIALDFALPMLRAGKSGFFRKKPPAICADFEHIPLADGSLDLVWSNMALHWASEPLAVFREFARVLAPEGLLMFSTLGPDTLKELRTVAGSAHVHAFLDMHDLGDMLVAAGFAAPVMDMELVTLRYTGAAQLVADLRASGQANARRDRARGLSGKRWRAQMLAGPAQASYEVVYGHAWRGAPRDDAKKIRIFKRLP